MKKKYSIGLLAVTLLLLTALTAGYRAEDYYMQKQQKEVKEKEHVLTTQGDAIKKELYYLAELNGYVVVYQNDLETVYEYTSIRLADLPEELQSEIRNIKLLEGTDRLYGFLENYSS